MIKYYIDTAIWIDLYEGRKGFLDEPLGEYALRLLSLIKATGSRIIICDFVILELRTKYSLDEIEQMLKMFEDCLERFYASTDIKKEAKRIAIERNIPMGDVLHAIICRENDFVLVTRDKHFRQLRDITAAFRPEDLFRHP